MKHETLLFVMEFSFFAFYTLPNFLILFFDADTLILEGVDVTGYPIFKEIKVLCPSF